MTRTGPVRMRCDELLDVDLTSLREAAAAYGAHETRSLAAIGAAYDRAVLHSPEAAVAAYSLGTTGPAGASDGRGRGMAARANADCRRACARPRLRDWPHRASAEPGGSRRGHGCVVRHAARGAPPAGELCPTGADGNRPALSGRGVRPDPGRRIPFRISCWRARQRTRWRRSRACWRPPGTIAILNLSYRGLEADRADLARWARRYDLTIRVNGEHPFSVWDGAAFILQREG